ncbi:MAG TPA: hypothetical protein VEH27_18100 [Methylomirabilota bacterium]|nr:hypothetical protein [Methylomirabilota bacterium]
MNDPEASFDSAEIDRHRLAGEISLVLEHGTLEEKRSMARLIRRFNPNADAVLASYDINHNDNPYAPEL